MELFWSAVTQAIISGIIVVVFTKVLEKNQEDSKRADTAEKELLRKDIYNVALKFHSVDSKQDSLVKEFHELKENVVGMAQKQDNFQERLFEVIQKVEKVKPYRMRNGLAKHS